MNILVTGASGFIGRRLMPRLNALGHDVSVFSKDITIPFPSLGHFDLVIHLAAYNITHVGAKDAERYNAVNVEGTRNLLNALDADKFIYLSTAKVYRHEGLVLTEDSPLAPQGAYAESKLRAEELCRDFLKEESLVILRAVNVLGWGQASKAVLPVFFQKAKANEPLDIIGNAQGLMQCVYAEDLIDAIVSLINIHSAGNSKISGNFNLAHEEPFTLEQLARKIIAITGSSSILNIAPQAAVPAFSPVECAKAYQQLGWKAKTGIAEILALYNESYAESVQKN